MNTFSLLSNAVLPETNPLLLDEDLDPSMGEDFQKMLNDWENHIGSLQTSEIPEAMDSMTSLVGSTSSEVTTNVQSTPISTSCNVMIKNEYNESLQQTSQVKPVQQLSTTSENNGRAKMTLGQMALAGIVISSGPGDHFETYEGTFDTLRFALKSL